MKKLALLILIAVAVIGCEEKNQNVFEGSEWVKNSTEGSTEIFFYSETNVSFSVLSSSNQIIVTHNASYDAYKNTATIEFSSSGMAAHEAIIAGSSMTLTNLSTGNSYKYNKKGGK
jgi:hypothetical protein